MHFASLAYGSRLRHAAGCGITVPVRDTAQEGDASSGCSLTRSLLVATFPYMRSVGIKVLNSRLSEYVRLAASGETVLVTDRDRVVAEIGPPRETRSPMLADALLAEAVRKGWLTPPTLPATGEPSTPERVAPLRTLLGELDADRSER